MAWKDTDGNGHKELSGDVASIAAEIAAVLGVNSGLSAAAAAALAATGVGAPAVVLGVSSGLNAAAAAAAGGLAYFADRYGLEYKLEPGPVIDEVKDKASDAVDLAKDKAGDLLGGAKDKADNVIDWLRDRTKLNKDRPPSFPFFQSCRAEQVRRGSEQPRHNFKRYAHICKPEVLGRNR